MIQGIQNVSFGSAANRVVNKAARKAEETFVAASSNLAGTVNATRASRMQRDAQLFADKDTLISRIASLTNSKKTVPTEDIAKSAARAKANEAAAIAEAKLGEAQRAQAIGEFGFFG